ncbi:MAG: HD-GYP domain-containing protein [Candidatus Aminicenantia bacterium]
MVRLSEIIRKKIAEKKSQDKIDPVSEAIKIKKDEESMLEIQKIYEDIILYIKQIMNDIREGKTIEGREIVNIAEKIVDNLHINSDILLSLINKFAVYEKEEDYLYAHSVNVSILATNLGLALGYDKAELIDLCTSALVHDIGMVKIPQEIIDKPKKLTKEEYDLVKKHPLYGLELLDNIKDLTKITSEVVYQHHEKIDGTGYPEGKSEEEISEHAKIVAIAEVYEALTHPRPFRSRRILPSEGVKMVVEEAGSSFEPKLLKVLLNYITCYPIGSFILLNNNEIGRVISANENLPLRPVIEIVFDAEGKSLEKPKRIDLAKSPILYIKEAIDERNL